MRADSKPTESQAALDERRHIRVVALVIVALVVVAYANTLTAPFVFDDEFAIVDNASIRRLSSWREVLSPPPGAAGAVGRPVVNLSLALNYAIGGLDVRVYHVFNLAIHAGAALVLFGFARRTLRRPVVPPRVSDSALMVAAGIATVWTVHPLLTETVACVVQRSESVAALFVLLVLYCFVRSTESSHRTLWSIAAVASCFLGIASKEFVVVAPVLALIYDRAFVAGTFREAWRARKFLHGALASSWLVLGLLVANAHGRNETVGFGEGIGVMGYALTQSWAVTHYLVLSFWPATLVLDYGTLIIHSPRDVVPQIFFLAALLAVTAWAIVRRPTLGFVGACFFLLLAPSSSVLPLVTQTVAEHRMYLPLAAVVTLLVLSIHRIVGRRTLAVVAPVVVVLGLLTERRNADYLNPITLWSDTVAKRPDNARAHTNLGNALNRAGAHESALAEYVEAVRLQPTLLTARKNLANALLELGRLPESIARYDEIVLLDPGAADAWHNRGNALLRARRLDEAIASYEEALKLDPRSAESERGLGNALIEAGRISEARPHLEAALAHDPDSASLHGNLGNVLLSLGRVDEARGHYEMALRLDPGDADAHNNLGALWLALRRPVEAAAQFREALRLRPQFPSARANLEKTLRLLPTGEAAIGP